MKNAIIFSGSGGQGIMSMGIMLAQSAVESGKHAVYLPSYGAEQRGGSAKCVVIIDDEEIVSPMTKYAGTFVALSDTGYNKFIDELEPGGLLIYDSALVTSKIERDDITAVGIPAGDIALEVGSPKVANVIINGVIIGLMGIVSQETFQQSFDLKFAKKSEEVRALNRKALQAGIDYANSHR